MEFVQSDKTITMRQPSTANLMVDSADRSSAYRLCNDFVISRNQNLMNGFFTRVGTTEVVFEWTTPNIWGVIGDANSGNSGCVYTTDTGDASATVSGGFYSQKEYLDAFVRKLNDANLGYTFTIEAIEGGEVTISFVATTATEFTLAGSAVDLIFGESPVTNTSAVWGTVGAYIPFLDLRPARYIDIVCTQLTNNQAVKDASTAEHVRDVLCRWYFDYDAQTPTDAYGYPILMGYAPFYLRRIYSPPKQIQWQTNISVGQLSFQLYNNDGQLQRVDPDFSNTGTNYLMTLQMSEN